MLVIAAALLSGALGLYAIAIAGGLIRSRMADPSFTAWKASIPLSLFGGMLLFQAAAFVDTALK